MKNRIILVSIILGILVAFWMSGVASAETDGSVIPVVHVIESYSGSLTIGGDVEGGVMDFGYLVPGGEPETKTLTLNVTANANWQITVTTTQNLAVGGYEETKYIPPDKFTFTSSGDAGPTYVTSDTPFRTSGHSHAEGVTVDVVTNGTETGSCGVNMGYKLEIPATQPEGYYSAGNHVYTLIVGD